MCGLRNRCTNNDGFLFLHFYFLTILSALRSTVFFVTYKEWNTNIPNGAIMHWHDVRFDPGNNYDKVTGAYTAPYNGYYQFTITKRTQSDQLSSLLTLVDSATIHQCWSGVHPHASSQTSCTIVIKLLVGQKVQIRNTDVTIILSLQTNADETLINTWFAGYMLSPS